MSKKIKSLIKRPAEIRALLIEAMNNANDEMVLISLINDISDIMREPSGSDIINDLMDVDYWDNDDAYRYFYGICSLLINHQSVMINDSYGSLTQIAIPVVVYLSDDSIHDTVEIETKVPNLLMHSVGKDLMEELGIDGDVGMSFCPFLISKDFFNKDACEMFSLHEDLMNKSYANEIALTSTIDKKDMHVFFICGVITEVGRSQFIHTKKESGLNNPLRMRQWREKNARIIQSYFNKKGKDLKVTIGPATPLINSLRSAPAYVREANMWDMLSSGEESLDFSTVVAVVNENPDTGRIILQLFQDNHCVMVFDCYEPVIEEMGSKINNFLDKDMIECKLRYHGLVKIMHSNKDLGTHDLSELLEMPLIG